jgi:hypothetical protein
MKILTQDTNGDGRIDQYGFCGWVGDYLPELLMSNGTFIASGPTENISSREVGEVLQYISEMHNKWKVCPPIASNDPEQQTARRYAYRAGNVAFFPIATHINSQNDDYGYRGGIPLGFDTVWVRWPVGPSGNQDTNAGSLTTDGNVYMIPVNVAEPELVFNFMDDYWNWYDGDLDLRAAMTSDFAHNVTSNKAEFRNHNYAVMCEAASKRAVDFWESACPDGFWDNVNGLLDGTVTPAQVQDRLKDGYQSRLQIMFN